MKDTILYIGLIAAIIMIIVTGIKDLREGEQTFKANSFSQCTTVTESMVTIGNEASTQVLPALSGRSYAMLQLVIDVDGIATNTPSVAFGATATLINGIQLSTSTPTVVFGMDTNHPYSGIVSMITDKGTTTVRVTECR